ncbi:LppW family protein [Modestobacter sp. I12A-02628]|uniref:LppW family protein n=1 Tax=Goekera deserti TaxID=2497753 RepID=A0A7K3WE49_9ACTN|nr:LppW family protein [Goekera deserti]MPQ99693.1 LppW family protein [Goekera deserti]NDI46297.1 LppW family protein [Goekera deserti]NEL54771.1 LppW family protein [Goekera deserti]
MTDRRHRPLHWWAAAGVVAVLVGALLMDSSRGPAPRPALDAELTALVSALEGEVGTADGDPDTPLPAPVPPLPSPEQLQSAQAGVDAAAAGAGGRISVVVTSAAGTLLSSGASEQVYTASLVKLLVVERLLALEQVGALVLDDSDRRLMAAAMTTSDDGAMSTLWDRHDGEALVLAAVAAYGLTGTAPPATPGQWGEAVTTAGDMATVLSGLPTRLAPDDAATLLGWMRAATPDGADGFDQTFGLLTGTGDGTGAKQGWMCCVDGTRQLHSVGVLADGTVVTLLGDFPSSTSWGASRAALDAAAAAVRTLPV